MNTGEKRRKRERERLKALGKLPLAREMIHRAELLEEGCKQQDEGEDVARMAAELRRSGEEIRRQAAETLEKLGQLTPQEQEVLIMRYQDRQSWTAICRKLHYSRSTLAAIERRAIDRLGRLRKHRRG